MLIVISAGLLSVIGAVALQRAHFNSDRSGIYSVGGYIAFIVAFSLLEYSLIEQYIGFVFGLWAVLMAIAVLLIGWLSYQERVSPSKWLSFGLIAVGLVGMVLT